MRAFSPFTLNSNPFQTLFNYCNDLFNFLSWGSSFLDSEYKHSRYSTASSPKRHDPFTVLTLPQMAASYFPDFTVKLFERAACILTLLSLTTHSFIQFIWFYFSIMDQNCSLSELSTMWSQPRVEAVMLQSPVMVLLQSTAQPVVKWNVTKEAAQALPWRTCSRSCAH